MVVRDNFEVNTAERLEELGHQGVLGLAIEHLDYGYFGYAAYISKQTLKKLRPMRRDLMKGFVAAPTIRSWFLKDEFDEFVMRVAQSGIQSYWLMEVTYRNLDPSVQIALKLSKHHSSDDMDEGGAEPLTIDRMVGMFYMYGFGMLLSIVAFIGESLRCRYFKG